MKEVYPNLYCGCDKDFPPDGENWSFVHAARDPWHRKFVGYETPEAPEGDSYWWAEDGEEVALNLPDVNDEQFFFEDVMGLIERVLDYIDAKLNSGKKVLVHCNQGATRAPLICMSYVAHRGMPIYGQEFDECEGRFREVYPEYNPTPGFRDFVKNRWDRLKV